MTPKNDERVKALKILGKDVIPNMEEDINIQINEIENADANALEWVREQLIILKNDYKVWTNYKDLDHMRVLENFVNHFTKVLEDSK